VKHGSIDDVLAVLWGVGGLVVAGYFVHIAIDSGDIGGSGPRLLVLAAVALIGFTTVAVRHHLRAREERAQRSSGPVGGWGGGSRRPDRRPREPQTQRTPHPEDRPATDPPRLSDSGRATLARIVGIADRAGLFAPRTPHPVDLIEAVADAGEPVTLDTMLAGLAEAGFWRPGFRAEDHLAALAFHDSHTEQLADTLTSQAEDLARLVADALTVRLVAVDLTEAGRAVRTRLRLELGPVGAGEERTLEYRGAPKYLSTVLHVTVARALRAAAPEPAPPRWPRLAWTWSDQGVWLAALRTTSVGALNTELGRSLLEPWQWVDEQEPTAAGD
jgi:hypothetical protein